MKQIIGILIAGMVAVIISTLTDCTGVGENVISTLYTVVGILFSVGMSLIIAISVSNVKNLEARTIYRSQLKYIRTQFISIFVILSILFIVLPKDQSNIIILTCDNPIKFSCNIFIVTLLMLTIVYYIANFFSIQTSVYELEDRIDAENEKTT